MFRCNDSPSGNPTPVDASSAPVALSRIPVVLKHCRIDVREAAAVTRLGRSGARPAQRDPDGRGFLDPRIEALQLGGAYRVNPTNRTANRHRPCWDHSARAELVTHVTRVPGGGPGPECSYTAVRNFASNPQNRAKGRPCHALPPASAHHHRHRRHRGPSPSVPPRRPRPFRTDKTIGGVPRTPTSPTARAWNTPRTYTNQSSPTTSPTAPAELRELS